MKPIPIVTGDQSPTLYIKEMDETYHSRHGARQESEYVYIHSGLAQLMHLPYIRVFEMGFGTGLNILLTHQFSCIHKKNISVTTIDAFPLKQEIWSQLNYGIDAHQAQVFNEIHQLPWEVSLPIDSYLTLCNAICV